MFPRVVVRERALSGEPPAWYVYRDGGWLPTSSGPWWQATDLPRVEVSLEGWVTKANASARGLLGIDPAELGTRHFTDFVAPGTLDDSMALFEVVEEGRDFTATVLMRPTSGEILATDLHGTRIGNVLVGVFRLAAGVDVPAPGHATFRPELTCIPATDVAFRAYALQSLSHMSEPTPEGLALRLRRLYPHARVEPDGPRWIAHRDSKAAESAAMAGAAGWWRDASLPRVRYDAQALILDANDAAEKLLGRPLVGHYWQEFVTPGSTEQVSAMLTILAEVGEAESRFRMPTADGPLVEFDSYTQVEGESFTTVMRPRPEPQPATATRSQPG
jgi:PAS domain-containing protein